MPAVNTRHHWMNNTMHVNLLAPDKSLVHIFAQTELRARERQGDRTGDRRKFETVGVARETNTWIYYKRWIIEHSIGIDHLIIYLFICGYYIQIHTAMWAIIVSHMQCLLSVCRARAVDLIIIRNKNENSFIVCSAIEIVCPIHWTNIWIKTQSVTIRWSDWVRSIWMENENYIESACGWCRFGFFWASPLNSLNIKMKSMSWATHKTRFALFT